MDIKDIELPPGWHIQKSGGRPRKDAKFVAIAMARMWLIQHRKEKASAADRWILAKWGKAGVTDEAHIRTIVRRISKGLTAPLRNVMFGYDKGWVFALSARHGKGWIWSEQYSEALALFGNVHLVVDTNAVHVSFDLHSKS